MQFVGEWFSEVIDTERGDDFIRWQLLDEAFCNKKKEWESCDSDLCPCDERSCSLTILQRASFSDSDYCSNTSTHTSKRNATLFRMQSVLQSVRDKRWQVTHESNQPDCKLHDFLREETRAVVSKAVPSVRPERLPLSLSFSAACQQQVVGSAEDLCSASLAKCTGLIALLKHASTTPL